VATLAAESASGVLWSFLNSVKKSAKQIEKQSQLSLSLSLALMFVQVTRVILDG
jgi:hypothetical protein